GRRRVHQRALDVAGASGKRGAELPGPQDPRQAHPRSHRSHAQRLSCQSACRGLPDGRRDRGDPGMDPDRGGGQLSMAPRGRIALLAMALLAAAWPARTLRAHIVPVPPSVCAFQPFALNVPATGVAGDAQAAGPADALRVLYDASASQVQLCPVDPGNPTSCGVAVPRSFSLGAATGTVTLPPIFDGRMLSSGDVTIFDLPVTLTVGTTTTTRRVTLTTGLVSMKGTVAQGTPLQGLGSFTLVGRVDDGVLPAPLADAMLVTLSCQPRPVPDKTQFLAP